MPPPGVADSWNSIRKRLGSLQNDVDFLLSMVVGDAYPEVDTRALLPDPVAEAGKTYLVRTTTGIIPFRKHSGLWRSDGATWIRLGRDADPLSVKIRYESNADTNAFTDAEKILLGSLRGQVEHTETPASAVWAIIHNKGVNPVVAVRDNAGVIIGGFVSWPDVNTVVIDFSEAVAGSATLVF